MKNFKSLFAAFVFVCGAIALTGCMGESTGNADDVKKMSENQAPSNNPDVAPSDASNSEFGGGGGGPKKGGG